MFARNLALTNNSRLIAGIGQNSGSTNARGSDIPIEASGDINLDEGSFILNQVGNNGAGNSGNIDITANSLMLNNTSFIGGQTLGRGDSGDVTLNVANRIEVNGASSLRSLVERNAVGNAGDITIDTGVLRVSGDNSLIFANTRGTGNAGNVNIDASDSVTFIDNSSLLAQVSTGATGNGGDVYITVPLLEVRDFASIVNSTDGVGNAGNISIQSSDGIVINNDSKLQSNVRNRGMGNAGNIEINTGSLLLTANSRESKSQLLANSIGRGNAGNIIINADRDVTLDKGSFVLSNVTQGKGNGGDIDINSDTLVLNDRSFIISNTGDLNQSLSNIGNAGDININSRSVSLNDFSTITSNTVRIATGSSGNVNISADNLRIAGGSVINALTENDFDAGEININVRNIELASGGKIVTGTDGRGNAGNIMVNVSGNLNIDGTNPPVQSQADKFLEPILRDLELETGLFASTTNRSSGNGGNINIDTAVFTVNDNAQISVNSQGKGNGGVISIDAKELNLDTNASISAATSSGRGGEIFINLNDNLRLSNNSRITAQAFNNADGGNIDINANFVIAFPDGNNDILANAEQGRGGDIEIKAESLFGIEERPLNDSTNDINASSAVAN